VREDAKESIVWRDGPPPSGGVLALSFTGWNDAGSAASAAIGFIGDSGDRRAVAEIDPELFYDFQAHRPRITVHDGEVRQLEWPRNTVFSAEVPGIENEVVLLAGEEPSTRWRTFADTIVHLATECEVELVVTLGAFLAEVPHTRPATLSAIATDADLIAGHGFTGAEYEGPTGIVGVLHAKFGAADIPACSLWAAVPHYVAATPNPPAALDLVRGFEAVTGGEVDKAALVSASERFRSRVSNAVEADEEISDYVTKLEAAADAEQTEPTFGAETEMASGESIAAEIERFLREQD
jgi:proteasome assembly chaperone (PAC2) family protein